MRKRIEHPLDLKKLKNAIKQSGIEVVDFAEKTGSSLAHFNHILSGYRNPSATLYKLICLNLNVPEDTFYLKPEPPNPEMVEENVCDKQIDRIEVQLDRMERKLDRLEMIVRSVQNENLALRQEILKRK